MDARWASDAEPSLDIKATGAGFEVWATSASRGRLRLGVIPHVTIAYHATAIRGRRN